MAVTRRSARLGGSSQGSGEPASSSPASASKTSGKKRKAATDASPSGGKKSKKAQKTLEETMPEVETEVKDGGKDADVEMKDGGETETVENGDELKTEKNGNDSKVDKTEDASKVEDKLEKESQEGASENPQAEPEKPETKPDVESKEALTENTGESESVPKDDSHGGSAEAGAEKSETEPPKEPLKEIQSTETETKKEDASKKDDQTADDVPKNGAPVESTNAKPESNGDFIEEKHARDDKVASNIIEKGIIYFFTRGRVNVEEPEGVQDLQRTFFVLRPIQTGAKLGDGPIDDSKTNRLFALPKKVFPESGKDRFMAFVEKAKVSMKELKEEFFQGSDYETKAGDSRHTPSVDPVGEGVYAITEVGRGSHLSYMVRYAYCMCMTKADTSLAHYSKRARQAPRRHRYPRQRLLCAQPEESKEQGSRQYSAPTVARLPRVHHERLPWSRLDASAQVRVSGLPECAASAYWRGRWPFWRRSSGSTRGTEGRESRERAGET